MNKRLMIGVIMASCHVEFQEDMLKGIIAQAFRSNCNIAILALLHDFSLESLQKNYDKKILELILSDKFDGFLYAPNSFSNDKIRTYIEELLERSKKPVMLLDSNNHKRFESTAIDDCSAFEQITDHMIDFHHYSRIYCLTGYKNLFVSEERLNGYKNSMKNHGLYYDRNYCIYGDFWKDAAKKLARNIANGDIQKPDAIICGNDVSAIALIEELAENGLKVPEDIAVTGYDDTDDAKNFNPSVTTFRRPNFQLGAESFRRIYRIITGKICAKVHNKDGTIILRKSCGCIERNYVKKGKKRRNKVNSRLESDFFGRDMVFDISDSNSIKEFADKLDNYTYYIYKIKHLEICLTKKFIESENNLTFENGDFVKTILSKSCTERHSITGEYFSSSEILPLYSENLPYPSAYYISPLHFKNNFFGYSCISFGKDEMSFSDLYNQWIKCVNISLEHLRLKLMLKNELSMQNTNNIYDKYTGILNRYGLEKKLSDIPKNSSSLYFIRINITGLKSIYFQNGEEECNIIKKQFVDFISESLLNDELFGVWNENTLCIITSRNNRNEEITAELVNKIKKTQFSNEKNCNIDFIVGVHSQSINTVQNLSNAMHRAFVNKIFHYNISESNLNPQFEKICSLRNEIMKNPELQWSIDSIADNLYLSKSYLQKVYKNYFGKGIIEEMIEFRIEKAKKFLAETDMTITEISKKCGYSSYNYFVRQFKTAVGVSPTEYREKTKK